MLALSPDVSPAAAMRNFLWSLAVTLHHDKARPRGAWGPSADVLGMILAQPRLSFSPAFQRRMEGRFLRALLAEAHEAERVEERAARVRCRSDLTPPESIA